MNIEEARLYLEHTSKDDFNLEEHQKENRYQAIQVVLKEIERLNNIINELEKHLQNEMSDGRSEDNIWLMGCYDEDREILDKLRELKGVDKNE